MTWKQQQYVIWQACADLVNAKLHKDLTGEELHVPKVHGDEVHTFPYLPLTRTRFAEQHEFLGAGTGYGKGVWSFAPIQSGSYSLIASTPNHPGIIRFISNATLALSGYYVLTISNTTAFLLGGGEESEFVFSIPTINDFTMVRMGFQTWTAIPPKDGVWIEIADTLLYGTTASNGAESYTGTTFVFSTDTWYRAKLVLNADATRVDFYLFDGATGTLLWTDYLTTYIPTATGRETGHGISARSEAGSIKIIDLDYMSVEINRDLVR